MALVPLANYSIGGVFPNTNDDLGIWFTGGTLHKFDWVALIMNTDVSSHLPQFVAGEAY